MAGTHDGLPEWVLRARRGAGPPLGWYWVLTWQKPPMPPRVAMHWS
jgi:hypothetical protein